jgi:hypothetical protein
MKRRCPACRMRTRVSLVEHSPAGRVFRCMLCDGKFDESPDEGGTHADRPDGRLRRTESRTEERRHLRGGLD